MPRFLYIRLFLWAVIFCLLLIGILRSIGFTRPMDTRRSGLGDSHSVHVEVMREGGSVDVVWLLLGLWLDHVSPERR